MEILLVDDNPDDRSLARRGLEQGITGTRITEAGTSATLDAALADTVPDVAVIDYALGWADGLEVFRRIRAVHPDCGVVMFTGSLGEEGAVDVMRAGIDDYLVKDPFRLPRLAATVEGLARRVEDRRACRRAEARNAALRRSTTVGMLSCRTDGTVLAANPAGRRMLGLDDGVDIAGINMLEVITTSRLRECWGAEGGPAIGGLEVVLDGGRSALLDAHAVPDTDGEVECVLTDVTDLRIAVQRSQTLLREVYHRVYNNLQVMDSFLAIQARKYTDPSVRQGYKEVSQRLRALALVQQRLHRADDFVSLDFPSYLQDLAQTMASAYARPEVAVSVEGEPALRLPIDTAIPLGLVTTELLANAYKHAFPEGRSGSITVSLSRAHAGDIRLMVSDDGIGAPGDIYRNRQSTGIGSLIVPLLATQLNASVSMVRQNGTVVSILVPSDVAQALT
jgi:two-component sensor histidine kinase